MKIHTNISGNNSIHDPILFPSIERQVYDFFCNRFATVGHRLSETGVTLIIDGRECPLEVLKGNKGVRISSTTKIRFGEKECPSIKLPYNKNVMGTINKFSDILDSLTQLEARAEALPKSPPIKEIENFLKQELATDYTTVMLLRESIFNGFGPLFYIYPNGENQVPANGVLFCLESDNKIVPFWNASTPRRTHNGYNTHSDRLEFAVGNKPKFGNDIASMKKRIEAIEQLEKKIREFDPSRNSNFMSLLDLKKQANELVEEFNNLTKA